ncbi:MAG: hypothetical protein WCH34_05525 [Bacteroidota bacterium]
MLDVHPQYITNSTGKTLSVILPVREFNSIIEELEELDDIRLFDEVKAAGEPSVPIDEAFIFIEHLSNNKCPDFSNKQ